RWGTAARGCHGVLADHILRILVGSKTLERRMSKRTVVTPLRERDLAHQYRIDPVCTLRLIAARRIRKRRLVAFELPQSRVPRSEHLRVESGADLARVAKLVPLVYAEQQRAESLSRALRLRVAADHHLLPFDALDLQPLARACCFDIAAVDALADCALEPE